MSHVLGTVSARATSASNPITTAGFTVAILDTVLVLLIKIVGALDRTGGAPSIAGLSFSQANSTQKAATNPEAGCELWYLLNPHRKLIPGSYALTIPNTGTKTLFYQIATGRAKAGGSSQLDGAAGANNTSTNPGPGSITTTEDGDIGFAITAGGWTKWAPSARAGTLISDNDDGAHGGGTQYHLQGARAAINLNWTFATSDDWGAVAAYFKEVPPQMLNNYMGIKVDSGMSTSEKIR